MDKGHHSLPKVGTVLNKFLVMRWKRDRARIVQLEEIVAAGNEVVFAELGVAEARVVELQESIKKLKATNKKLRKELKDAKTQKDNAVVSGVRSDSGDDPLAILLVD